MQINISHKVLFFLLITFNFSYSLNAQTWKSLNGPLESDVRDIIIESDTVYIVSVDLGGLYKKHINSEKWTFVDVAIINKVSKDRVEIAGLNSIEISPNGTYYAAGSGINVDGEYFNHFFVSNDFGKSWEAIREGINYFEGPVIEGNDIFISSNGQLIIGFANQIFIYHEEEKRFIKSSGNAGLASNKVFTFYEYGDTLVAGRITGIEYSSDKGENWISSSFDSLEVLSIEYVDGELFAGTDKGLYKAQAVDGYYKKIQDIGETPIKALHLYKGFVIVGTDSGVSFINLATLNIQPKFQEFALKNINSINSVDSLIFIGTDNGVYECTVLINNCDLTGVQNSWVRTINFQNQDTLWAGTTNSIHRYFLSEEKWDTVTFPIDGAKNIIPFAEDSFFTVNDLSFFSCSFQSSICDSIAVDPGIPIFDLKQNTAGNLFIASREQVFISTNNGENWEIIYTSPESKNFSLVPYLDSLLFINSDRIRYDLTNNTYDILSKTVHVITEKGIVYSSSNGIHKSSDFGDTWTTVLQSSDILNQGLGGVKFLLFEEEGNKLYAITTKGAVFVSKNEGVSWGVNKEMFPLLIESSTIGERDKLYLGTSITGLFVNTIPLEPPIIISNEFETTLRPKSFTLHQNYPNPFNPSTTFSFELSQSELVSLNIYNTYGQLVFTKSLGRLGSGLHSETVNLSEYASGMYLIRLTSGSESQTIKMMLIK